MEAKETYKSYNIQASIIVDVTDRDLVSRVVGEVLDGDLNLRDFSAPQNIGIGKKLILYSSVLTSVAIGLLGYWLWQREKELA